jgi:hypothetical protein
MCHACVVGIFVQPTRNLHGTIRTLDRVGSAVDLTCQPITTFQVLHR